MSNKSHHERYFINLLLGFSSIIGSVLITFYTIFEVSRERDWYFWAIVAAFLMCSGVYFSLYAFTHKIKSDFNRRQRQRDQQQTFLSDDPSPVKPKL